MGIVFQSFPWRLAELKPEKTGTRCLCKLLARTHLEHVRRFAPKVVTKISSLIPYRIADEVWYCKQSLGHSFWGRKFHPGNRWAGGGMTCSTVHTLMRTLQLAFLKFAAGESSRDISLARRCSYEVCQNLKHQTRSPSTIPESVIGYGTEMSNSG